MSYLRILITAGVLLSCFAVLAVAVAIWDVYINQSPTERNDQ